MNLMSTTNRYMIDNAEEGNFLDIGACTGEITVEMAARLRETPYNVYAFEPDPDAYATMLNEIKGIPNILPFEVAITNKTGEMKLFLSTRGGHTTSESSAATGKYNYNINRHITINAITLDDFVEKHKITNITGIKLDVEASEQFVLEGAKKTLTTNKTLIALETHDNIDCGAIYRILHTYGYRVYYTDMSEAFNININGQYVCKNY